MRARVGRVILGEGMKSQIARERSAQLRFYQEEIARSPELQEHKIDSLSLPVQNLSETTGVI